MRKIGYILIAILAVSCRLEDEPDTQKKGPIYIVATTGIIADCVTEIVGDSAEVSAIMGPGTDPHIYKPTPDDMELLDDADVIITNGLHLEGKMAETLQKYGREKPVLVVSDGISEADLLRSADAQDAIDPHIWFDPKLWMDGMWHIAKELGRIDTSSKDYYMKNYERYLAEVKAVDAWAAQQFDSLHEKSRTLITSHDAFSYFGRKYGVQVKGIQGISTLSEVGLREISDMVNFVIDNKIKSIFIETSTSDRTAKSIVDGCKDKGYQLGIKGPLYSDALGEPDSEGGTYIGMIRENVKTIVAGLK